MVGGVAMINKKVLWIVATNDELTMIAKAKKKQDAIKLANDYHTEVYGDGRDDWQAIPVEEFMGTYDVSIVRGYNRVGILKGYTLK